MGGEDPRRSVPSVERVVSTLDGGSLPHAVVVECARLAVDAARARANEGVPAEFDAVVAEAAGHVEGIAASLLRPVVNATGVLVHTNLGRTPLPQGALDAAAEVASGFSNLEYDLATGRRGSRHEHAGSLLARAVGAEAGIVVNNNAAAVMLVLAALARDREVVVSRGELVEIGGGFRVPDVMAESGARLVEVGTTNRTRRSDYEQASGPDTALLLKVHASNYRMVGFVESVEVADLATVGPPVAFDAGSGLLDATTPWLPEGPPAWLAGEPGIRQAVAGGASVVTFSGDKLLGGPQAGIVVGRRAMVEQIARHPLARAVRADKLTLAALQWVALAYLRGEAAELPLWQMATVDVETVRARAKVVADGVDGARVVDTEAVAGGGSLPGVGIPSAGVALDAPGHAGDEMAAALRRHGIVARVEHDTVVCDLRTVDPADDGRVADALAGARQALGPR